VSIGIAVGFVGVAFGVLAEAEGLSVAKACALSLLVFTGASQFAAVSVLGAGGTLGAALGSALLLSVRNGLYGPVVARWFGGDPPLRKAGVAQIIIDESTAVGAAQPTVEESRKGFLAGGLGVYVAWNLGTLLGALGGSALGDTDRWGLDAAFPAAFVALLAPHVRTRPGQVAAVAAAAICVATVPGLPAGIPVLLGAIGIVPAAWVARAGDGGDGNTAPREANPAEGRPGSGSDDEEGLT